MPPFHKILATTALSLAAVGVNSCQQPRQAVLSDPDNMERFRPIMFYNCVPVGEIDPYAEEKKAFSGATERMKLLSADEKTTLALAIVDAFDKAISPLGLHLASSDFITEFTIAARINAAVEAEDVAMWDDMLGWQNVLPKAMATLPQELQQKLKHEDMDSLLDCYAAYMIMRYAELNDTLPATTRAKARGMVALIIAHADGEHGHRSFGVYDYPGYTPMQPDYSRVPEPDEDEEN